MKKINKIEPKFFRNFIRTNKPVNWDGINKIRPDLRKYILEAEQRLQCAYCESSITPCNFKSHIDHFKPKHYFPELIFDYSNLFVSCNNPDHCASTKDVKVKSKEVYEKIVNPINENPDEYFEYGINGKLISKNDKAIFTEDIFKLNHPGLKQRRNDVAWAVQAYKEDLELQEVIQEIGEFESFIKNIW